MKSARRFGFLAVSRTVLEMNVVKVRSDDNGLLMLIIDNFCDWKCNECTTHEIHTAYSEPSQQPGMPLSTPMVQL